MEALKLKTENTKKSDLTEWPAHQLGNYAASEVYLMDCIEGMKHYPDNYFDLAVVDPPYGIGYSVSSARNSGTKYGVAKTAKRQYSEKHWDNEPPPVAYFIEVFRVSKNQVIWGANHFISRMPYDASCWVVWDKDNGETHFADCEMAWTSFKKAARLFKWTWNGMLQQNMSDKEDRFHPTQKPVALYDWLITKFAEPGQKILDTHLGSGSSRVAANKAGLDFVGFEIDEEYFAASDERFKKFISQTRLF